MWSLRVRPLSPDELTAVRDLIEPPLVEVFLDQSHADRRHGFESARFVQAHGGDREVARAALLHDVGKRHARLGIIGRSMASVLARLGLPAPGRLGRYLEHGRLGAADLERLGVEQLAVSYARSHHGDRPPEIGPEAWGLLSAADTVVFGRDERAR